MFRWKQRGNVTGGFREGGGRGIMGGISKQTTTRGGIREEVEMSRSNQKSRAEMNTSLMGGHAVSKNAGGGNLSKVRSKKQSLVRGEESIRCPWELFFFFCGVFLFLVRWVREGQFGMARKSREYRVTV